MIPSCEHDKDTVVRLSPVEKDFTRPRVLLLPECLKLRNLSAIQLGEHRVKLFQGFRHRYASIIWLT